MHHLASVDGFSRAATVRERTIGANRGARARARGLVPTAARQALNSTPDSGTECREIVTVKRILPALTPYAAFILSVGIFACGAGQPSLAQPPAPDERITARLLELGGEGFRIHQTEHFTIAYDTPWQTLQPHTDRLEKLYDAVQRFCTASALEATKPARLLPILFFDEFEAYQTYAARFGMDANVAGFYLPATNVAAFLHTLNLPEIQLITKRIAAAQDRLAGMTRNPNTSPAGRSQADELARNLIVWRGQRDAIVRRFDRFVLQHEAAHQILFNLGAHTRGAVNPPWLVEGLACQFEVPPNVPQGTLHGVNQMRLADLREALGVGSSATTIGDIKFQALIDEGRLVQLDEFVGNAALFQQPDANRALLYAQAWALVLYLHREHPAEFSRYVRHLARRKGGEQFDRRREIEDFTAAFAAPDAKLLRDVIDSTLRLHFDPQSDGP